jgi:hypothetical protein
MVNYDMMAALPLPSCLIHQPNTTTTILVLVGPTIAFIHYI